MTSPTATRGLPQLRTPLDRDQACIRILTLHRASSDSATIECSLQVASLDKSPDYATLSYAWGALKKTRPIIVDGQQFEVTVNLYDFLNCLRRPDQDVQLWADAICINQSDEKEKEHQIGLMGRIYSQCTKAHIWLGHITPNWQKGLVGEGFKLISQMTEEDILYPKKTFEPTKKSEEMPDLDSRECDSSRPPEICVEEALALIKAASEWTHLYELIPFIIGSKSRGSCRVPDPDWPLIMDCVNWIQTRTWWKRVWTYQEAALPRVDPQIHIGSCTISLNTYLQGMYTLCGSRCAERSTTSCHLCPQVRRIVPTGPQTVNESRNLSLVTHTLRGVREILTTAGPEMPLQHVIALSKCRQATEVRDHLFGFLGVLPNAVKAPLYDMGYQADCGRLFGKCSWMVFSQEGSLKCLRSAIAMRGTKIANLPSWAQDLSGDERILLALDPVWETFDACGDMRWSNENVSCQPQWVELRVKGVRVAAVSACAVLAPEETEADALMSRYPSEFRQIDKWRSLHLTIAEPGSAVASDSAFWRTILRDRDPLAKAKDLHVRMTAIQVNNMRQWWTCFKQTGNQADDNYGQHAIGSADQMFRSQKVCTVVSQYKFFCTAASEPGLGPYEVQAGDEIFALAACSALAVLRRIGGSEGGRDRFRFVGLCFVDGWMDGEAAQKPGCKWEDVYIC